MSYNGILQKHWLAVAAHFILDATLFCSGFILGTAINFAVRAPAGTPFDEYYSVIIKHLHDYYPSIVVGTLLFPCGAYISGLYSPLSSTRQPLKRLLVLAGCYLVAFGFMVCLSYINFSARVGRGVMLISTLLACSMILAHHVLLLRRWKNFRERVALIVTCAFDEVESQLFKNFWQHHLELAGFIRSDNYEPGLKGKFIGCVSELAEVVEREKVSRVLCTNKSINDPAMRSKFCQLRYSGVTVMPLISVCEEVYQTVPLELITSEWLLSASSLPHMFYIKKLKRAFDIAASLSGLVCFSPFLLLGALAVKLTSRGPVFYHQVRCGRFGRPIKIVKLRTMNVDAEKSGAVWAGTKDERVTLAGRILRKYRVDEIPQILNVLRGEMSFVGPRPERPEFIDELARQIPLYQERLMVQPGITGWAQVNYPYGNSIEDARRKLEYDLYYMKHMSVFLDVFILLDTVRTILRGGVATTRRRAPFAPPEAAQVVEMMSPALSNPVPAGSVRH